MILPIGDNSYMFWCAGCESVHIVDSRWILDADTAAPTLTPSVLVQDQRGNVCHLHLSRGIVTYLADCTHALKGTAIPLPDFPAWMSSR